MMGVENRSKTRAAIKIALAGAAAVGGLALALDRIGRVFFPPPPPQNLLVVSLCSLRAQELMHYGAERDFAPNINRFFKTASWTFENLLNPLPWTNFATYTRQIIPVNIWDRIGYVPQGDREFRNIIRIPGYTDLKKQPEMMDDASFENSRLFQNSEEKNIAEALQDLRQVILTSGPKPFFLVAHIKYLHYPLIDRFNPDSGWDRFLDAAQKRRLNAYLNDPGAHPDKLPFLLLMTNDLRVVKSHPDLKGQADDDIEAGRRLGLLSNPEFIRRWRQSEGFEDDLEIIRRVYRANLIYLDRLVGEILDLYGVDDLKRNTVVLFTGDHGELHMERDQLTHAETLTDDSLRVPAAVHFPGRWSRGSVPGQLAFQQLAETVYSYMKDKWPDREFGRRLERYASDPILARTCSNRARAVRDGGRFKYIYEVKGGRTWLYDLIHDPAETVNIASRMPDVVAALEARYWELFPRYRRLGVYECEEW